MWGRRKRHSAEQRKPEGALREALREARNEAAARTAVVVDLRDAEIARLEIVNEEINPVFAEIPDSIDLFDRGISRGDVPRLWIDAIAHVEMGRDKRTYRFVQDSRYGRQVLAESLASRDIVEAITRYVARRLIERERALAAEDASPFAARTAAPRRSQWRGLSIFLLGAAAGLVGLFIAAWLSASFVPGP